MSDLNPYEEGLALERKAAQDRIKALVEAAEDLIGQMDMSDDDDPDNAGWELYTYAGKFRRLAKALAALRAGGDG